MIRRGRALAGKGRLGAHSLRRRSPYRPEKTRILIVCEGQETEPNYFRGLREEDTVRQHFHVVVQKGKGGSCLTVMQQAIAAKNKAAARAEAFDEVWCVFDVEQAGKRTEVIKACQLADRNEIRAILSNPSFECWLLAHFERTSRAFAGSDEVIADLNTHWRSKFRQNFQKNEPRIYERLANLTKSAIQNARCVRTQDWSSSSLTVDCNSATDVYLLVERLLWPTTSP